MICRVVFMIRDSMNCSLCYSNVCFSIVSNNASRHGILRFATVCCTVCYIILRPIEYFAYCSSAQ